MHESFRLTEQVIDPTAAQRREYWRNLVRGHPVAPPAKVPAPVEFSTVPTADELVARGLPPTTEGERWMPPTLSPMREHLLRRLGLVSDPTPDNSEGA